MNFDDDGFVITLKLLRTIKLWGKRATDLIIRERKSVRIGGVLFEYKKSGQFREQWLS